MSEITTSDITAIFMVVLTAIYVFATILILCQNKKSNSLVIQSNKLLSDQIENSSRPNVTIGISCDTCMTAILIVKNEGNKVAERIKISIEGEYPKLADEHNHKEYVEDLLVKLTSGEYSLVSGDSFNMFFGQTYDLFKISPGIIQFNIRYKSNEGKEYENKYSVDIHSWANVATYNEEDTVVFQLKEISKKLGRSTDDTIAKNISEIVDEIKTKE